MVSALNLPHSASTGSHTETKSSASVTSHSVSRTSATKASTSGKPPSKSTASTTLFTKSSAHAKSSTRPLASDRAHAKAPLPGSAIGSSTFRVSSSLAHQSTPLPKRPLSQQHIASIPSSSSHYISSVSSPVSSPLSIKKAAQSSTASTTAQSSTVSHSLVSTPSATPPPSSHPLSSTVSSSSFSSATHQAVSISPSNAPSTSSPLSSTRSSGSIPPIVNGLKTSPDNSVAPETSSVFTTGHSSGAAVVTGTPAVTGAADTIPTFHANANGFMSHKATAGGILAVAAIMILALVAAVLLFCRRRHGKARAERHRRWRRGISWPASDSDGGYDPFFVTPRTAPAPPMTEMFRDAYISRSTVGSPIVGSPMSAVQPNPFDRLARPAPIATSAILSQRMETPTNGNFGYPFRTMYPDQPLDAAADADANDDDATVRDNASVHSSAHRASPSLIQSSPSMYAASLPEVDADSLYARETQAIRPANANPFGDPQPLTSPSVTAFNVTRKPVPPIPPRHRSRPSLTSVVLTPPVSDNGLGLTMAPATSQSEEYENNLMTPTRRTFLNIRPKRSSNGGSSTGEAL